MKRLLAILFAILLAAPALGQCPCASLCGQPYLLDKRVAVFSEEWMSAGAGSGAAGQLGWSIRNIGAAPALTPMGGIWPNIGQFRLATTAVINQGGEIALDGSAAGMIGRLDTNTNWDSTIIVRIEQTATTAWRVGFRLGAGGVVEPASGIWIRFDNVGYADTDFTFECRAGGASTLSVVNSIAADTNYHSFRIRSVKVGEILFSVDGRPETAITTNLPAVALAAFHNLVTGANAIEYANLDKFAFQACRLVR